ncbi:MAG: hypothetical protein KGD57_09435 [Candidatus Lokiarchaeota archaeon]|nr:hypothetical protein [Candidatus Lokiarchaeota archaeon]
MNRLGLLTGIFTCIILLLPFIPIGIYFWNGVTSTVEINSFVKFPVSMVNFNNVQYFLWGISNGNTFNFWINSNSIAFIITFIFLTILSFLAIIFSFIGCAKENPTGKKYMSYSFYALIFIVLYTIFGFTIYSEEIFNINFDFLEIIYYLDYGFYILLLNLFLSYIAYKKHQIKK